MKAPMPCVGAHPFPVHLLRAAGQLEPEPAVVSCVVLDFDGTLTDADRHAKAFEQTSRQELARRLGLDEAAMMALWQRASFTLQTMPDTQGWQVDGYAVCPARADPYLISNSITRMLLLEHGISDGSHELQAIVSEVHSSSYHRVLPPFRPQARELLEQLLDLGLAVRVVTNSQSNIVSSLLRDLKVRGGESIGITGGASKFSLCEPTSPNSRFDALPSALDLAPVGRVMHLRRGRYFDVLQAIWETTGVSPQHTMVVGDIFELDLAMPAALGSHVHLVVRDGTLEPERRAVQALKRGALGGLGDVLGRLEIAGASLLLKSSKP